MSSTGQVSSSVLFGKLKGWECLKEIKECGGSQSIFTDCTKWQQLWGFGEGFCASNPNRFSLFVQEFLAGSLVLEKCWDLPVPPHSSFLSLPSVPPAPHCHIHPAFCLCCYYDLLISDRFSSKATKATSTLQGQHPPDPKGLPQNRGEGEQPRISRFSACSQVVLFSLCHLQKWRNCFHFIFSNVTHPALNTKISR